MGSRGDWQLAQSATHPGLTPLTQQGDEEGGRGEQKGFCCEGSSISTEALGPCLAIRPSLLSQLSGVSHPTPTLIFPVTILWVAKE